MSAEQWEQRNIAAKESIPRLDAASAHGDGDSVGASAPGESTEPSAGEAVVSPAFGGDQGRPDDPHPGNLPLLPLESAAVFGQGSGVDEWPDHREESDALTDDPGPDAPGAGTTPSSWSAYEGAGVTVDRVWRFGPQPPRPPAIPREDAVPEPVMPLRHAGKSSAARFRRNPSVDEAIAELAMPLEEPTPAEQAAAMLRSKRPAKPGSALRPPASPDASASYTPQQRLLLLDTWTRSGLPARDFGTLVGVSHHTLYVWKKRFDEMGPAGLEDAVRGGPKGSKMPEVTRRAILMIKQAHPAYGCERISHLLARGPALPASASAVARVLKEAGYEPTECPPERHAPPVKRFERTRPNALWQTDLFTFVLKQQNRRLHLVVFMDDHSRFIVGWGLFSSPSTEMVVAALKEAVASCQAPTELLTDNGPQYVTWRGASKFAEACRHLGIRQIVARPRRPQTLGKVERFWGTLWRDFLAAAIFADAHDARRRIGRFMDAYNFDRPHQSLKGLAPADCYFGDASEARAARARRLEENRRRLEAGLEPITGDGSLPVDDVVNTVPEPGADPLTAGLMAAAGMGEMEAPHVAAPEAAATGTGG